MQPIVSLVLVVAFGGGPAIAAACAALCGPAMNHDVHAMHAVDTAESAPHAASAPDGTDRAVVAEAGHVAHHHASEAPTVQQAGASAPDTALTRAGDCCTQTDAALTASVVPVRLATLAPLVTPVIAFVPLRPADAPRGADPRLASAAVPVPPAHTRLALRI